MKLAVKKEYAQVFAKLWNEKLGESELIYTRTGKGRDTLLKAQSRALIDEDSQLIKRQDQWQEIPEAPLSNWPEHKIKPIRKPWIFRMLTELTIPGAMGLVALGLGMLYVGFDVIISGDVIWNEKEVAATIIGFSAGVMAIYIGAMRIFAKRKNLDSYAFGSSYATGQLQGLLIVFNFAGLLAVIFGSAYALKTIFDYVSSF